MIHATCAAWEHVNALAQSPKNTKTRKTKRTSQHEPRNPMHGKRLHAAGRHQRGVATEAREPLSYTTYTNGSRNLAAITAILRCASVCAASIVGINLGLVAASRIATFRAFLCRQLPGAFSSSTSSWSSRCCCVTGGAHGPWQLSQPRDFFMRRILGSSSEQTFLALLANV